ncbi:Di-copper centre-containing protein [Terfezia boudieri ATCC MYA-4762]|uniref:tyrosinase n=1 Tax=Terfezia boudieri ATCC MYA-4762 TaxID=1051890 RepID=A0A3N4LW77_9PEZI|nr:Di-copper centre-containing protein [Terfezia boudieri ATCC MYA-4762]
MATTRGPDYVYLIQGVKTGGICPRKEIDDFKNDPRQLILFTRAFQIMSERPKDDVLSYYQLAGIHGAPEDKTWPPVGGPPARIDPRHPGYYCYHWGPLFFTWHRIYVLCIEQALHDIIMRLIDPHDPLYLLIDIKDPGELKNWKTAAETWRLPYWDFALRRPNNHANGQDYCCLPDLAIKEVFESPAPGTLSNNPNPWYAYVFPEGSSGLPDTGGIPLSIQTRTVRHAPAYNPNSPPIVDAWRRGISDINSLKSFFQGETINWRADLIDLMINNYSYGGFTEGVGTPGDTATNNLNDIHGSVHVNTGGYRTKNGNMSSVPSAGFDPIFFLWHCNVDRIGAMWQAANDAWMDNESNVEELIPFRYSCSEFWTSDRCRYPQKLGHTYPDLALITDRNSLIARVADLYSDAPKGRLRAPVLDVDEYVVTAKYETHEVGPFYLDISLKVHDKEILVSSIVNFVSPVEAGCASCQKAGAEHHTVTTSTLISPKLRELYEQGKLSGLGHDLSNNIEQKLAESLQWKCYYASGDKANQEISSDEFTSLQVGVSRRVPEERRPIVGPPGGPPDLIGVPFRNEPLRRITDGKPFGLHLGEDFKYSSTS